jgi:RND family efflux transporter MFP subunit
VTLSFVQPGLVAGIHLSEGSAVTKGQVVAQLDTTVEEAQLKQIEAESKNTTRLDASEASLAQKRVDLNRLEKAAQRNAATDLEVQHAILEVRIAELSLALSRFEHEQAQRKYTESKMALDRMQLKSPIQGFVEAIHLEQGESVNALEEVMRLVRIDPLWIDASLPVTVAAKVKAGQTVKVQYTIDPKSTVTGKILHVAAVADAASDTLKARIEVPNKEGRPAGAYVWVIPTL